MCVCKSPWFWSFTKQRNILLEQSRTWQNIMCVMLKTHWGKLVIRSESQERRKKNYEHICTWINTTGIRSGTSVDDMNLHCLAASEMLACKHTIFGFIECFKSSELNVQPYQFYNEYKHAAHNLENYWMGFYFRTFWLQWTDGTTITAIKNICPT